MNFEGHTSEKSEYKFNEVTSITGVKPYVLRFWETEFEEISPKINEDGDKFYSKTDLDKIKRIKALLFADKLSIPEAKLALCKELESVKVAEAVAATIAIEETGVSSVGQVTNLDTASKNVATQLSSLDMMKAALEQDLSEHQRVAYKSQINDQEVLKLVQAKKKLSSVLTKVNQIITDNQW